MFAWDLQPVATGSRRVRVLDNSVSQQIQILLGLLSAGPRSLLAMLNDGWEVVSAYLHMNCHTQAHGYVVVMQLLLRMPPKELKSRMLALTHLLAMNFGDSSAGRAEADIRVMAQFDLQCWSRY
jgi:hypothetical protein